VSGVFFPRALCFRATDVAILGQKSNAPEPRSGLKEFDSNFSFSLRSLPDVNDFAGLLFSGFAVANAQVLVGQHRLQQKQSAMSVDDLCASVFEKTAAIFFLSCDDHGDLQKQALTTTGAATFVGADQIGAHERASLDGNRPETEFLRLQGKWLAFLWRNPECNQKTLILTARATGMRCSLRVADSAHGRFRWIR
jgi:hypothetical protein